MYDLPPRRRISLILVKLGPAHSIRYRSSISDDGGARERPRVSSNLPESRTPSREHALHSFMLNTWSREQHTVFYSYLACCVEYMNLEYVRMHVICRVNQAKYAIRIPMATPQENVNTWSTRRILLGMDINGTR